jgi:methylmalonyl-CoA/ethylmalonyl-CoA epimerase
MMQEIVSRSPAGKNGMRLHHIGFVVASIEESVPGFVASLNTEWDGKIFNDPLQDAKVTFLRHGVSGTPLIELVEPGSPESHLVKFLKRSGGLHHLCYETDQLEEQLRSAVASGSILVRKSAPAIAFEGRAIAWFYTPERLLIELLESKSTVQPADCPAVASV